MARTPYPDVTRIERDVVAGGSGAEHHHTAALDDQTRHRERRFAGVLKHDVDIALAGNVPDRLAKAPRLFHPGVVFGRADFRHLTQHLNSLRLMTPLAPRLKTYSAFD